VLDFFPDAARFLAGPLGAQIRGLITDGHAKTQSKKVRALGLDQRGWTIVYTGALGPDRQFHKPHPRAFELIEAAHRDVTRFVYIGDNISKDFIAPRALGWTSVQVLREDLAADAKRIHAAAAGPAPENGVPDFVVRSLDELSQVLAS
jgi:putative hydrolase of the HAD superfamily